MMDYTILTIEVKGAYTLTHDECMRIEDAIANILKKDEENVELASQDIVDW